MKIDIIAFIEESNQIEGINRPPTDGELSEFNRFMDLQEVTVADLQSFAQVYEPGSRLRLHKDQNVQVGGYEAPPGGQKILYELQNLLSDLDKIDPFTLHNKFQHLHPFTDCNGRSGRMLWAWQTRDAPLGFLHTYYYQSLQIAAL